MTPGLAAFAAAFVAAAHSHDRTAMVALFHPVDRACIASRTRAFFDSLVDQQRKGFPSGTPSSVSDEAFPAKSQPSLWAYFPPKAFPYPVMPARIVRIEYDAAPDGLFLDEIEVARSGSTWYLVTACPTTEGMRLVRRILAASERQAVAAKVLSAKIPPPELATIEKLLKAHDRFGAVQAYQRATGADFATASSVIDQLEYPNP